MAEDSVQKSFLFALLALQNGFIDRSQLLAAFGVWIVDKSRSLESILCEQTAISAADQNIILQLVERHWQHTHGDSRRSAALASGLGTICNELRLHPEATTDILRTIQDLAPDDTVPGGYWAAPATQLPNAPRFRIIQEHARGGLGLVSLAEDLNFNREVAFKQIRAEYADKQEYRDKFLLEAEVTGQLEHPGIVPVYALGEDEAGRPFYAMRFIKGEDLKSRIQNFYKHHDSSKKQVWGAEFRQLLRRFLDCCNAINYAHDRGVLHRDLKPSNVMLGRHGETLVVDWGLAKPLGVKFNQDPLATYGLNTELPLGTPDSASGSETRYGTFVGTAAYASPEQVLGNLDQLGPTSDIYSLGAILYELLTSSPPVTGKTIEEVMRKVTCGEIPKPSELRPTTPKPLEAICMKALATSQAQRYQTVAELRAEVERWLDDQPVQAYQEPYTQLWARWIRQHPRSFGGLASAVLIGAMSAGVSSLLLERKNQSLRENNIALVLSRQEAQQRQREAEQALFNSLLSQTVLLVRQANQLGWSWDAMDKLQQAIPIKPEEADAGQLRSLLATTENARDFRHIATLAEGIDCAALCFSHDGRYLAVGQRKHHLASNIYIYATDSWNLLHTLSISMADEGLQGLGDMASRLFSGDRYQEGILAIAFSRDGKWLTAGTRLGRLHSWRADQDFSDHRTLKAFPNSGVVHVAFDPSSIHLIAATDNYGNYNCLAWQWHDDDWLETKSDISGQAQLVQTSSTGLTTVVRDEGLSWFHGPEVKAIYHPALPQIQADSIAFSNSGSILAVANKTEIDLHNIAVSGGCTRLNPTQLSPHSGRRSLCFTDDDSLLAVTSDVSLVTIFDTVNGSLVGWELPVPGRNQPIALFSPTQPVLAVAGLRGVEVHELRRNTATLQSITIQGGSQVDDAMFDDNRSLWTVTQAELNALPTYQVSRFPQNSPAPSNVTHVICSPSDSIPLEARFMGSGSIQIHIPAKAVLQCNSQDGSCHLAALGPETESLAQTSTLNPSTVLPVETGVTQFALSLEANPSLPNLKHFQVLTKDPDAQVLFGITENGYHVQSMQLPSFAIIGSWESELESAITGSAGPTCLESLSGKVVVGSSDGFLRVLTTEGHVADRRRMSQAKLMCISREQEYLAIGAFDGTVIVTSLDDLAVQVKWPAHDTSITATAIAQNGQLVVSGSASGEVTLWQRNARNQYPRVLTLPTYSASIRRLAFDDRGQQLVIVYNQLNLAQVWNLDVIRQHCQALQLGW